MEMKFREDILTMADTLNRKRFGAKPFWAWNGKLEKEELLRQIHIMKEMGFGGFFMHSRTGLETEYLGEEWFELINACADEAERLGMEAWLYDEDRWPSGSAGGKATVSKKYRMKYLRMNRERKECFEWRDDIITAFLSDVDGINYTHAYPISRHTDLAALDGEMVVYFTVEAMLCDPVYNGTTYLDTLSREATEHFIDLTHRLYREKCGDRIGRSIPGIFTDEPYRGALMSGFSVPNRDGGEVCPYTENLFDEFEKAFGYRLEARLPELFLRKNGNPYSPVKWQYTELLTRMFLNNFARPYHAWCRDNNMKVTGHILHENSLTCQVSTMGSVMRYYPHMDIPGVDYLGEYGKEYCVVKQLASVCRQIGKTEMLSELDGCTGWQMTFDRYKHIGDWQAIMGITLRCPHLSWYTMKGEAKRDYPASILHQSCWYEAYSTLEDYYTRLSAITSTSARVCHTAVLMPVESVWAQIHAGWANGMAPVSAEVQQLETTFAATYNNLFAAHVDFDYIDEALAAELGRADESGLTIGQATYDTVIVSGMATIRRTTLELLCRFAAKGGRVLFAGDAPFLVDAVPSDEAQRLAGICERTTVEGLKDLTPDTFLSSPKIMLQTYRDENRTYYLLLNTDTDHAENGVTVRFNEKTPVIEYTLLTGESELLAADTESLTLNFAPGELKVLTDLPLSPLDPVPAHKEYETVDTVYANDRFRLSAGEPNLYVMDTVSYRLGNGEEEGPFDVLDADRRIRSALSLAPRGGSMLQPWFLRGTGDEERKEVSLLYRFHSDIRPDKPLDLVYEDAERLDALRVNGVAVNITKKPGVFLDVCFARTDIAPYIQEGENTVELIFGYRASSGVEAVYLCGDFLADADAHRIYATGGTPEYGSLTRKGYPFYGGKLTYRVTFDRMLKPNERAILHLGKNENVACYEANGVRVAFAPFTADVTRSMRSRNYCDITLYLTRRNTFGPFHLKEKNPMYTGPDTFLAHNTEEIVLLDTGLLERPYLEILREKEGEN